MVEITYPWVLWFIPLPWLLRWLLPQARQAFGPSLKVPFYQDLQHALHGKHVTIGQNNSFWWWAIIWLLLVIAASTPRWVGEPRPLQREGRNIMMALDLSGSMEVDDMLLHGRPVSRLAVVKRAAEQFVKARAGDRIGLILFGSKAYLQTPLTYDRLTVLDRIQDATVGLAGKTTAIGDALGLSVKRLQDVPAKGRIIILLTDGVNNAGLLDPLPAAELAKKDGIKVYTIGLGSKTTHYGMDPFIQMGPVADLDEKTLRQIAQMTGGQYFRATDPQSLNQVYDTINQIEAIQQNQATVRPQIDYYPWFAAAAWLLAMAWLSYHLGLYRLLPRRENSQEGMVHE
ncbi:VWA domain-containing protein [Legionella sp. W05-934-2]|jgi:Ca-activated chloride channel family protein|uniref:vWA domain-containing protein n=1 Tax=Legionella sp. W05-934-2 TaxID=1198649 RepID=UPI00346261B0